MALFCALALGAALAPRVPGAASLDMDSRSDSEVLLDGKNSMSLRATVADLAQATSLQSKSRPGLLWVRRSGKEYVIQDPKSLRAVYALFSRQAELGREQKEIGNRQRELGEQQREIGKQQAAVGKLQRVVGVSRPTPRAAGEPDRIEPVPGPLGDVQRELKAKQDQLESKQAAYRPEQRRLAARQREIEREQEQLNIGLAEKLRTLVDEAVAQGPAQPVTDATGFRGPAR